MQQQNVRRPRVLAIRGSADPPQPAPAQSAPVQSTPVQQERTTQQQQQPAPQNDKNSQPTAPQKDQSGTGIFFSLFKYCCIPCFLPCVFNSKSNQFCLIMCYIFAELTLATMQIVTITILVILAVFNGILSL